MVKECKRDVERGCLWCDSWKPSFLPLLIFDWRTFSRRVLARWWRQSAKNQVSTNQNSRNRWRLIVRHTIWLQCLNWLIEQLIMDCFDFIFISTEDLAYFISIFSLVSWFVLFLAAPAQAVQNGQKFSTLFGKKYYFIQKLKFLYYNNLFGNLFQTAGVTGLIRLLHAKLRY